MAFPLAQDAALSRIFEANARSLLPPQNISAGGDMTGSTDMGDLSHLMPCIHPLLGGFSGALHSRDFRVADPEAACILPAKLMAMAVVDLLADQAAVGRRIQEEFTPLMTKQEYLCGLKKN